MHNSVLRDAYQAYQQAENHARRTVSKTEYASPAFYEAVFEWLKEARVLAEHVREFVENENDRIHDQV